MGKRKSVREEEITDRLERENRDLKSLNRSLMRRLKKVDRSFNAKQELTSSEPEVKVKKKPDCPGCGEGNLQPMELGKFVYLVCDSSCGFRKKQ